MVGSTACSGEHIRRVAELIAQVLTCAPNFGQPTFRARACRVSCSVCGISTSIAWLPVLSRAGLAFNTLERHHPACVRPRRDLHVACVSDESRCPHKRWCGAGQVGLCGRDRGGCGCCIGGPGAAIRSSSMAEAVLNDKAARHLAGASLPRATARPSVACVTRWPICSPSESSCLQVRGYIIAATSCHAGYVGEVAATPDEYKVLLSDF